MALSQVVDVEVKPADVTGVRIRYKLGAAELNIALSALYQLVVPNPSGGAQSCPGCGNGRREWERSRRRRDAWAANTPCWAALGELGWEGCSDEDNLMSSCGMNPPSPASPRSASPAKPAPAEKPKPRAVAPPKPTQPQKTPPAKRKSFEPGSSSSSDEAHPRPHEGGKEKQPRQQKRREEPPSLEGDESPDPLLGEQVYVPYTDGVYPWVVTSVVGGAGGKVWVEHLGEKEMFRVGRHLLYASHAAALTHWEEQKAAAAGKKADKAKKKPNPKPDADAPPEPAPKPAKPEPKPEAKQAPQPEPKAAPQSAPIEVDARGHPAAKPAAQPLAGTHAQAPDGGETQATAPLWEDPTGHSPDV